jgi:tetratricopeptide (TPR) repeat protein
MTMMILQDRSPNWTQPPDSGIHKERSPPALSSSHPRQQLKTPATLLDPKSNQHLNNESNDVVDDDDDGNMDGSPVLQTISRYRYDTPPRAPTFQTSQSTTKAGNTSYTLQRSHEESSVSIWMNWAEDIITTNPQSNNEEPSISIEHFEQLELEQQDPVKKEPADGNTLALLSSPAHEDEEIHLFQDNDDSQDESIPPPPPPPLPLNESKEENEADFPIHRGFTLDGVPLDASAEDRPFHVYGDDDREADAKIDDTPAYPLVASKVTVDPSTSNEDNGMEQDQGSVPSWGTKITIDKSREMDNVSLELVPTEETSVEGTSDENERDIETSNLISEDSINKSQHLNTFKVAERTKKEDPPSCVDEGGTCEDDEDQGITMDGEPLDTSLSEASCKEAVECELDTPPLSLVTSTGRVQKVPLEPEEEYSEYDSINTSVAMNITEADVSTDAEENQVSKVPPSTKSILDGSSQMEDEETEEEPLEESFLAKSHSSASAIVNQGSVSSTQTMKIEPDVRDVEKTPKDDENSSEVAMSLCNVAWRLFKDGENEEALNTYKNAVEHCKGQLRQGSVLAAVNAAGCYRNMSTVSRKMNQFDQAALYMKKAEQLYVAAREGVAVDSAVNTFEGVPDESVNGTEDFLCLDALILETLHFRAKFHIQFQNNLQQAIECHEQCLKQLMHLQNLRQWDNVAENLIRLEGVTYAPLTKDQFTELLMNSLSALGGYYRREPDSSTNTLVIFEDALSVLQRHQEEVDPENDQLIDSVGKILRDFSEILFHRQELDRSVEALYNSVCVKLTRSGKPCSESLLTLDKMGQANEKMENYGKALECYERAMMARCKFYGNTHTCVAKSLVNIARVTELKNGNTEEVVELYRAANAIYAVQIVSPEKELDDDCDAILRMIPNVIRQGRYEKVINDLKMILSVAEEDKNNENFGISLDRAQIYFDLGRAYLGMGDYVEASACLVEAMKEAGNVTDIDVLSLLHRAENAVHEKQEKASPADESYHSSQDSDYVPSAAGNRNVSFHESVLLPHTSDRSIHIFEDGSQGAARDDKTMDHDDRYGGPEEEDYPEIDPRHSILYESFAREPSFTLEPSFHYNCGSTSSKKCWRQRAKLLSSEVARKIKDKVKRLHKPPSNHETSNKTMIRRKLNKLRKKCLKHVRGVRRNIVSPDDPIIQGKKSMIVDDAVKYEPSPVWETMILELVNQSSASESSKRNQTRAVIIRQERDAVEVENCEPPQ